MSIVVVLVFALTLSLFGTSEAIAKDTLLEEWRGEIFYAKQGGFYLKARLKGFKASEQTKLITTPIKFSFQNIISKKTYSFSHKLGDITGQPGQVWKIPSGKYKVRRIELVDMEGKKRVWRPKRRISFLIKKSSISNLGYWLIKPNSNKGLWVGRKMISNSYSEKRPKSESTVYAVIDGYSGLVQEFFAGKKAIAESKLAVEPKKDLGATFRSSRQIAMFYRLNLFKHNRYAKQIISVLDVNDAAMRRCYLDLLELQENAKGRVKFSVLLSRKTGTMQKIKLRGGNIRQPKFIECLYYELSHLSFPVKESMIGELEYTFDVR